ncbi:glycosyltransferase [Acinetobacter indicus]|uniref:glycosyltransferase n=1 Tax=Acinetobacter indicus TaxID=756892 RepID=UPI0014440DB5|nr:glycosyltransferase [Acinetobacter indicus]
MKNIKLLTSRYPYGVGEQFLEEEIIHWAKWDSACTLEVMPFVKDGNLRYLPEEIRVNESYSFKINYIYFFALITFSFFWKEIIYLIKSKKFSFKNLLKLIKYGVLIVQSYNQLKKSVLGTDYIYSYWSNFSSYGALLYKMKKNNVKVVTRIHRFDLYEDLYEKNYMPFKRQFINEYDAIFVLSQEGRSYLTDNFSVLDAKIILMPLGVKVDEAIINYEKVSECIKIVSVSNCIKVKRIDKIIDALKKLEGVTSKKIIWHHYGDGILKNKLIDYASRQLEKIEFEFKGNIENSELQKKLVIEKYDLIINASESEGVPVSLMEAMAKKIVPIAPDVGGIRFLVNQQNGFLLDSSCEVEDIYNSVINYLNLSESEQNYIQSNAFNIINTNYNSEKNYNKFIEYFVR